MHFIRDSRFVSWTLTNREPVLCFIIMSSMKQTRFVNKTFKNWLHVVKYNNIPIALLYS
jgi:hypothetical protein